MRKMKIYQRAFKIPSNCRGLAMGKLHLPCFDGEVAEVGNDQRRGEPHRQQAYKR